MRTPAWLRSRRKNARNSSVGQSLKSRRRSKLDLCLERLEDRCVLAFTPGNIAVLDLAAAGSSNTTGSILELSPATASQPTPVQTIGIGSTGANAMRFSDSGTSGFLSDSNDGTQLVLAAYNTTDSTTSDLATTGTSASTGTDPDDRAVATFDSTGSLTIQTHYVEPASGDQTRSATTANDTNYFITDKGGLFTNSAASASLNTNILNARSFGGTVYVSSTKAAAGVSTVASPTANSLSGLPGVPADGSIQDFYLIQSGSNGSTYDVLYTLDQNSSNATVNKFSLVNGTWVANGSATVASNATGLVAENDGSGAYLYVLTTKQAADNSLVRLTDSTGWVNSTTASSGFTLTNSTTLYTDTAGDTLKGIAFVPAASATAPTASNPTSNNVGINSATLGGTVTSTGTPGAISYGVVYSLTSVNSNPTIGGIGVTQLPGSGTPVFSPFTVNATGLQGTEQYSFAAYATNSAGTTYSSVNTFTTQNSNPPTIDTPTDTAITSTSATLGGTVESDGGATVTKSGVVYALTSVNGTPQIGGTGVTEVDTASPVDSGAFTVGATGLTPGGSYTFEAFAKNGSGTTYTTPTSFTTLAPPSVNTPTFTDVTSASATLGANIALNGGSTITKWGVVYAQTSVNGNPQIGGSGVTEVDASGSPSGPFTVPVAGLSASTGYTFEAFATNGIGTTYTAATSFSTAAPGVITAWTFPTTAGAPDNSPAPTYGTGTATTLGMGSYPNANGPNTAASDDVLLSNGTVNPNFGENTWRIRGTPNNGWSLAAPQYSQGIELDTSTVDYSNIVFSFDWYSTTQGVRDLKVQYNTGSGWVNYQGPSPTGTFVTGGNDYYNAGLSPVNPTIYVNLSNVPAANNNPDLGIRLVSAYDSTGTLGNVYASATSTPNNIVPYNNSSGNWRFGNLTFYGDLTTTTTTIAANPPGGQNPNQPVTFTATVTPAGGTQYPSGTVAFYDGNNQIGTTQPVSQVGTSDLGTASITLSTLAPGIHGDITAQYTPTPGNGFIASGSSMNLVAGDPTDNPISYSINAPQATGVDVSPVVGQPFTGVVATFSDGIITNPAGFSASITWGDGHTTSTSDGNNDVNIAFAGTKSETNINGEVVPVSLFTVTSTNTYAAPGSYLMSITITDPHQETATVSPTARVAYAPLAVTPAPVNAVAGTPLNNVTVAIFTDPGLVATMAALGIIDPTTQFSASIGWGDNITSAGSITYNPTTETFSVVGTHTYTQTGPYSISVTVTPLTVSVERVDSSDPTNLNLVGDENGDGLTDSPSPDFIDQYVIGPTQSGSFAANQAAPLYTTSLPAVATNGGNEALTNSSYSISEGEMTLSTNGQFLVLGGYNDTASAWAPQQTFSPANVINRVIGTVDGQGNINTTTDLTDAYSGDNFRGVASSNGKNFWTAGHSTGATDDFVHYAQLGATTSTILTGPSGANNINTVEIFNGQLYEGVRSTSNSLAGIFQIGNGLPTTGGQPQNLFIQVPQSDPLDLGGTSKPTSPFGFWMADLSNGNPSINGVNVAYIADAEMGIARYDYYQAAGESSPQWNFSYYVDRTGTVKDADYSVDSMGNVTTTTGSVDVDSSKLGGIRDLTGRVVNGQVQLFGVTGFGTIAQPSPGGSLVEVTDPAALTVPANGLNTTDTIVTLATNPTTDPSELASVAFSPNTIATSSAQVAKASPTITSTASAAVPLNTPTPTLSDSAVLAGGDSETGNLIFRLTGPNGFTFTQTDTVSGDATYTASDALPATGATPGTYTWVVFYTGDGNDNFAIDQGGTAEQMQVSKANPTITTTASPNITLGTTAPTLSDSAVVASGYNASGNLVFTLTGPNGFSFMQSDPLTGNGSYTASDTLPTTGTVAGTYTWSVSYVGDANNNSAHDQGGTAEQTVVSKATPTVTTTASPNVTLGTTAPTLSDSAVVAGGYFETGSLVFMLTGPNGFYFTQTDPVTGNGTYTASKTLPTTGTVAGTYNWFVSYQGDANNNTANDLGLGDLFYIDMENHNLAQPSGLGGSPEQLQGNPAAPYLNSLMTVGNANAAQASYASNYQNAGPGIHPSEPNYIWQEGGSNFGEVGNDDDPYQNNLLPAPNNNNVSLVYNTGNNPANLSGLLQAAGISWKSYQEDIDLAPSSGSVNQPGSNALTSTVAPQNQWTVPTSSFSGTSAAYTNPYNSSHQYNFAVKHDGQLFYTDTNGGSLTAPNFSPSNPEAQYYAPLQQLTTDLNSNAVAAYNLITPDQFNDMHSSLTSGFTYQGTHYTGDQSAIAAGDNFLSIVVPEIEASQAYKNNGAIVIWFDETEGGDTSAFTVPEIILSPLAKGNAYDSTQVYTHSSDLKTLQEVFGVNAPGGGFLAGANTPGTNDLSDMLKTPAAEQTAVSKANPTIMSTASSAVTLGTTAPTLSDSAALANGYFETGNLVFTLTGPGGTTVSTQNMPINNGNATYTANYTLPTIGTVVGTYTWSVSYVGDANNNSAHDQGGTAEQTVVSKANPTVTSTASPTVAIAPVTSALTDSAVLANGYYETGSLVFKLTGPSGFSGYTQTDTVTGNATYSASFTPPTTGAAPGTYTWVVVYTGDANNNLTTDQGGAQEQTVVVGPGVTPVGNALYLVGGNTTNDQVTINPAGKNNDGTTGIQLQGQLNGVNLNNVTYSQSFNTIYFVGYGGNDNLNEAPTLAIATNVSVGGGNDHIQLGNGNNFVVAGNGNDNVTVGNGSNVVTLGSGSNTIKAGDGSNLLAGGTGHSNVQAGNGNNILIDGSVQASPAVLEQVLSDWANNGVDDISTIAADVTLNNKNANTLHAGTGHDWFYAAYGKDNLNNKQGDLVTT